MKPVANSTWLGGYSFRPFKVRTTDIDFLYSRPKITNMTKGCNITAIWNPKAQETLVNGVVQGWKQTDVRGASLLSQIRLWDLFFKTDCVINGGEYKQALTISNYQDLKKSDALNDRRKVKSNTTEEALKGWSQRSLTT